MALIDNLIRYYKLDEISGTTVTDATGTSNGTNSGATVNSTGVINSGYDFNSNNDHINTNLAINPSTTDYSISFWVNPDSTTGKKIVSTDYDNNAPRGFQVYNEGTELVISTGANVSTSSGAGYSSSAYQHIVVVLGQGTDNSYIYRNGVEVLNFTGDFNNVSKTLYLCSRVGAETNITFLGDMDEVGIWNRALTSSEVGDLHNSGAGLKYPFTGPPPEAAPLKIFDVRFG